MSVRDNLTKGNAKELYEALQYSGLVTEDMTYDEMCEALTKAYPPLKVLYDNGDGCTDVSGGWGSSAGGLYTSGVSDNTNVACPSNHIQLTGGYYSYSIAGIIKAVDITGLNKIKATTQNGTFELDVSNYSGKYYISVMKYNGDYTYFVICLSTSVANCLGANNVASAYFEHNTTYANVYKVWVE